MWLVAAILESADQLKNKVCIWFTFSCVIGVYQFIFMVFGEVSLFINHVPSKSIHG